MYRSGAMTCTGQRNNTPPRKTVGFPNPCGNFSTKPRPTTPKAKVVRPEQIRVAIFPQKPHPEARQTAGMRYNYLKLDLVVLPGWWQRRTATKLSVGEKCIQEQKRCIFRKNPLTNKFIPIQSLADSRYNRRNPFKYSKYIWSGETSGTFLWQGMCCWSFFV